jgi:hypothetical protein
VTGPTEAAGAPRTLRVVSVSLGSSRRDHAVRVVRGGARFEVERRGVDGDLAAAEAAVRALDGRVDAIGLGGLDITLRVRDRVFTLSDGARLRDAASITPVVDGGGVKDTLERRAVEGLVAEGILGPGVEVLCVSALDRFGMAEALDGAGCAVVYGDLMFTAGIPYPIRSLDELAEMAHRILPQFAKLPISMLYPVGAAQERPPDPRFAPYYERAAVIAGDFHLIRRHLPDRLDGKTVLTNTTTAEDVRWLAERGCARLVTTTPVLEGRSFGANVIEAMAWAYAGGFGPGAAPAAEALSTVLDRLAIGPASRTLSLPEVS